MMTRIRFTLFMLTTACIAGIRGDAAPLGTGFTYQGRLEQNGSPVNGTAHLRFSLWDAAANGSQLGSSQIVPNVAVSGGLFTVTLNGAGQFGISAFNGEARWLQIEVCTTGTCTSATVLSPRQPVSPAPYALHAANVLPGGATNWIDNGDDVYLPTGKAGIGTQEPAQLMHLNGQYRDTGLRFQAVRFQEGPPLSSQRPSSTSAAGGTGQAWTSPGSAAVSDDVWASVSLSTAPGTPDPDTSRNLEVTGFGFTLPPDAVIVGIVVHVEGLASCSCTDCEACRVDTTVELLGGSGDSGQVPVQLPAQEGTVIAGDTFHLWDLEWTAAQLNASSFGVRMVTRLSPLNVLFCFPGLGCVYEPCDCSSTGSAAIDSVAVTAYYYDAAVSSTPVNWTVGVPQSGSGFQISATADYSIPVLHIAPTSQVGINTTQLFHYALVVSGAAAKTGGGSWSNPSDARFKENLEPMEGTLEKLLTLHGYEFEYTDEAMESGLALPGRQIGLLAQDVEKVFPDWVDRDPEGYLYVTERSTTALLVEALRDLRAEKDREIAALRDELEVLRKRVEEK